LVLDISKSPPLVPLVTLWYGLSTPQAYRQQSCHLLLLPPISNVLDTLVFQASMVKTAVLHYMDVKTLRLLFHSNYSMVFCLLKHYISPPLCLLSICTLLLPFYTLLILHLVFAFIILVNYNSPTYGINTLVESTQYCHHASLCKRSTSTF